MEISLNLMLHALFRTVELSYLNLSQPKLIIILWKIFYKNISISKSGLKYIFTQILNFTYNVYKLQLHVF